MKGRIVKGIGLISTCALVISSTVYADLLTVPQDNDNPENSSGGTSQIVRSVDELDEATQANVKPIGVINSSVPYSEIPTSAMKGTFGYDQDDDGIDECTINTYEFQNYLNNVYTNLSQEIDTNNSEIQNALDSSVTDIREHLNYLSGTLIQNDSILEDKINALSANTDEQIEELKKSVSEGKSAIASALTEKGVSTNADDTFDTMIDNISTMGQLQFDKGKSAATNRFRITVGANTYLTYASGNAHESVNAYGYLYVTIDGDGNITVDSHSYGRNKYKDHNIEGLEVSITSMGVSKL